MTTTYRVLAAIGLLAIPLPALHSQTPSTTTTLSDEVHRQAFDYLLGDWEFTGERNGQNGRVKFRGYWTPTRTPDNQLRGFDPGEHRWHIVSIERSGTLAEGKAWKDGNDMRIEQPCGGPVFQFPIARWRSEPSCNSLTGRNCQSSIVNRQCPSWYSILRYDLCRMKCAPSRLPLKCFSS